MAAALETLRRRQGLALLLVAIIAWGLIAVGVARNFAPQPAVQLVLALAVATTVPQLAYARMPRRDWAGQWLLLLLGVFMAVWAAHTMWSMTVACGASTQLPNVQSDARLYFRWAYFHCTGHSTEPQLNFIGFPLLMLGLFKLLGVNVIWPTAMNVMFTLLSVALFGQTSARVVEGRVRTGGAAIATLTMLLISFMFFYLYHGVCLLKEPSTYLGLSLVAYAMARMVSLDGRPRTRLGADVAAFVAGSVLLGMCRANVGYFVLPGIVLLAAGHWRRNWRLAAVMALVCVVCTAAGMAMSPRHTLASQINIIEGEGAMSRLYIVGESQSPYKQIIGDYFHFHWWRRLALLPFTAAVQFFIPFPWVYFSVDCTASGLLLRCQWVWYLVGGTSLYFYLFVAWRRGRGLGLWPLWPAFCFLGLAYVTGGSVSRYCQPFEPLFCVIAAFVLCKLRDGYWRHSFSGWMAGFAVVVAGVLAVCYSLQVNYYHSLPQ